MKGVNAGEIPSSLRLAHALQTVAITRHLCHTSVRTLVKTGLG